jgi:hypothetical protein
MPWPFGDKEAKATQAEAAQAESDRLVALPVPALAAEIMPAFGPDGLQTRTGHQQGAMQVTSWLMADVSDKVRYRQPVLGPVIEGLTALEHAGLLERRSFGSGSAATYHATRLGQSALAEGTVEQQLTGAA